MIDFLFIHLFVFVSLFFLFENSMTSKFTNLLLFLSFSHPYFLKWKNNYISSHFVLFLE